MKYVRSCAMHLVAILMIALSLLHGFSILRDAAILLVAAATARDLLLLPCTNLWAYRLSCKSEHDVDYIDHVVSVLDRRAAGKELHAMSAAIYTVTALFCTVSGAPFLGLLVVLSYFLRAISAGYMLKIRSQLLQPSWM